MYDVFMVEFLGSASQNAAALDRYNEVKAEINTIAGHRNALDGRVVDIAIWLLANNDWQGSGLSKPEQFLAFRCAMSPATARKYVRIAERATELPESIDALRRGELCLDQLMPIVRRVPAWADSQVLRLSKKLTVGQINAVITKYDFERSGPPRSDSPSADSDEASDPVAATIPHDDETRPTEDGAGREPSSPPPPPPVPKDRCWMGVGDDGRWRLNIETSRELGMTIDAAIDEARDRLFRESGNTISDAEALADVAARSLDTTDDAARRDRYRTYVHLNTDQRVTDHLGAPLPDSVTKHITCNGLVTPVFHANGIPMSVGRTQRIVPNRTRRTVLLRDGGCRVPGCGSTRHLEIHHVRHWSDGGTTDTWNLVALCEHHHRMHHHGRLSITGNADAVSLTFTNAHGMNMANDGPRPEPPGGPPPAPAGEFAPPLCERLDMDYVTFVHPERLAYRAEQAAVNHERTRAAEAKQAEFRRIRAAQRIALIEQNPHR